jgi:GAF domain-containing protein
VRGVVQLVLRLAMRSWSLAVARNLSFVPRPSDDPRTHASGIDIDRVLVFGGGAAVGWGVSSHDLALPGTLARALSVLTGRGTDVDVLADPDFMASNAVRNLASVDLLRYDAIVLTLGLRELAQFVQIRNWRRDFDRVLDYLAEVTSAQIYVLGVRPLTRITAYDALVAPFASRHRSELNQAIAQLSARDKRATFIAFDPPQSKERNRYRTTGDYRSIAQLLAARIAPGLNWSHSHSRQERNWNEHSTVDERARQRAVDKLDILDASPDERLDHIVAFAQQAFQTKFAALTVIDRDRQWQKSVVGVERTEQPRESSICAITIQQSDALVVRDVSEDDRFATEHGEGGESVRFYAGFPVEAPAGERIGALCVFDTAPRNPATVDRALLRDLALMVQREVWRSAAG